MNERAIAQRLADFCRWMVDERGYAAETRRGYRERTQQAERWARHTFGTPLWRLQEPQIRAFLSRAEHPKHRNSHLASLRVYFAWAVESGLRKNDPTVGIRRLPEPRYLPRPISVVDAKRLRLAAATLSLRHRLMVDLGLFAGLRRAEIAGLRWADVDLAGRRLRVFGKGRKEGVVPLHDELVAELHLWRLTAPSEEWLFPGTHHPAGHHVAPHTVWRLITEAGQAAGVKVSPHPLRHTFGTELLEAGSDIRRVQELMRHASLNSTATYTKIAVGRLEQEIARLDFSTGVNRPLMEEAPIPQPPPQRAVGFGGD